MSSSNKGMFGRPSDKSGQDASSASEGRKTTARKPTPIDTDAAGDEWQATRLLTPDVTPPTTPDAWQSTRAQTALATQFLKDEEDDLSSENADIGRQTGANERELFVSCDPAQAMRQQFEHLHPEFIAIHDIATSSSRKLLLGIAAASRRPVQKLVIRRQGHGTPLATLEFVDLTITGNRSLRLYTTEADADTAARHGLARTLLAFSRLGAVMVGELPAHAIEAALKPLRDDILAGPWPNRNLLLLPLMSASTLAAHGTNLGRGTGVTVRTAPQAGRPADVWSFITGAWDRLREQNGADGRTSTIAALGDFINPAVAAAVASPARRSTVQATPWIDTQPFEDPQSTLLKQPAPISSITAGAEPAAAMAVPTLTAVFERYVRQVSELAGVVSCCVFEVESGHVSAHAGAAAPPAAELGSQGRELLAAMIAASRGLGLGQAMSEAAITLGAHHLLLRPVPQHAGLALHAVFDKSHANMTLARLQVSRMDTLFDAAGQP